MPSLYESLNQSIDKLSSELSNTNKATALSGAKERKHQSLASEADVIDPNTIPLIGKAEKEQFYDADTIFGVEGYKGIRLGNQDSSTANYVNAPEKKIGGELVEGQDLADFQASMMAKDNFAMGTTPASIESFDDIRQNPLTPENYNLYQSMMKQTQGDVLDVRGTEGNVGKYGRQIGQVYNPDAPVAEESLEQRLLDTGNAQRYSYGKPMVNQPGSEQVLPDSIAVDSDADGYLANLMDAGQYGLGRKAAGIADAVVDTATRAVLETSKAVYGIDEEEAINRLGKIDKIFKRDESGDFVGLDAYKTAKEYGYDDSRSAGALKEIGDAKGATNTALAIIKNADSAPQLFLESLGELATGMLKLPGLVLNGMDYANQNMEDTIAAQDGKPLTNAQRAVSTVAGMAMAGINKLGTDEMIGRTNIIKTLVGKTMKDGTRTSAIQVAKELGKRSLTVAGKAGYEGIEEIVQESIGILATKYNVGANEIFDDETITQLKQAFGGGVLGGGFPAAVGQVKSAVVEGAGSVAKSRQKSKIDALREEDKSTMKQQSMDAGEVVVGEPSAEATEEYTVPDMDKTQSEIENAIYDMYETSKISPLEGYKRARSVNTIIESMEDSPQKEYLTRLKDAKNSETIIPYLNDAMTNTAHEDYTELQKILSEAKNASPGEVDTIVRELLLSVQTRDDLDNVLQGEFRTMAIDSGMGIEAIDKAVENANQYITVKDSMEDVAGKVAVGGFKGTDKKGYLEYYKNKLNAKSPEEAEMWQGRIEDLAKIQNSKATMLEDIKSEATQTAKSHVEDFAKKSNISYSDALEIAMAHEGRLSKQAYSAIKKKAETNGTWDTYKKLDGFIDRQYSSQDIIGKHQGRYEANLSESLTDVALESEGFGESYVNANGTVTVGDMKRAQDNGTISKDIDLTTPEGKTQATSILQDTKSKSSVSLLIDTIRNEQDIMLSLDKTDKVTQNQEEVTEYAGLQSTEQVNAMAEEMAGDTTGVIPKQPEVAETTPLGSEKDTETVQETEVSSPSPKDEESTTEVSEIDGINNLPRNKATKKSFTLDARILTKDEKIETIIDGKTETTKNGKIGEYVITGTKGEEYVVDAKTVAKKYTINKTGNNAKITTKPVEIDFAVSDREFTFTASWGEDMISEPGDALVYEDGKLSYRIEKEAFSNTYDINEPETDLQKKIKRIAELEAEIQTENKHIKSVLKAKQDKIDGLADASDEIMKEVEQVEQNTAKKKKLYESLKNEQKKLSKFRKLAINEMKKFDQHTQRTMKGFNQAKNREINEGKMEGLADRIKTMTKKLGKEVHARLDKILKSGQKTWSKLNNEAELIMQVVSAQEKVVSDIEAELMDETSKDITSKRNELQAEKKAIQEETKGTTTYSQSIINANSGAKGGMEAVTGNRTSQGMSLSLNMMVEAKSKGKSLLASVPVEDIGKDSTIYKESMNVVEALSNRIANPIKDGSKNIGLKIWDNPALMLLLDKDGNIDENVSGAIAAVAAETIATSASRFERNRPQDITSYYGIANENITVETMSALGKGIPLKYVTNSAGEAVMKQLGMTIKKSTAKNNDAVAFKQGLGEMVVQYMMEQGYIQNHTALGSEINTKYLAQLQGASQEEIDAIDAKAQTKLVQLVNGEEGQSISVGISKRAQPILDAIDSEIGVVKTTKNYRTTKRNDKQIEESEMSVKNNPYSAVYGEMEKAVKKYTNEKYTLDLPSMENLMELGEDTIKNLLGWKDTDTMAKSKQWSYDTMEAQKGKNFQIESELNELVSVYEKMKSGEIDNELYFDWFVSKTNRMFLDSSGLNPQTNKHLQRMLITGTESAGTADISNKTHMDGFYYAIGQAFGVSVDKITSIERESSAKEILAIPHKKLRAKVMAGLKSGEDEITINHGGKKTTVEVEHLSHMIAGLNAVEAYQNAVDGKFETNITMEVDGKTNGFAIKVAQGLVPDKNAKWATKTGMIDTETYPTMDDVDVLDSYQELGKDLPSLKDAEIRATGWMNEQRSEGNALIGFEEQLEAIKYILPSEGVVNGVVSKALRELMKPGFMTFNYSAGMKSIRRALAREIRKNISDDIVQNKNGRGIQIAKAFGINARTYKSLQEGLTKESLETVELDGINLAERIDQIIDATYGNAVTDILEKQLGQSATYSNQMNDASKYQMRMFLNALEHEMKGKSQTIAWIEAKTKQMMDIFPVIQGPLSMSREDGIAVFTTVMRSRTTDKDMKSNTKIGLKKGGARNPNTTESVSIQAVERMLAESMSASAVGQTQTIDGANIATMLNKHNGVLGIFDAVQTGIFTMEDVVSTMNEDFYKLNESHNMYESSLVALEESIIAYETRMKKNGIEDPMKEIDTQNSTNDLKLSSGKQISDTTGKKWVPETVSGLLDKMHKSNQSIQNNRNDLQKRSLNVVQFVYTEESGYKTKGAEADAQSESATIQAIAEKYDMKCGA